ncbi:hypothetical protein M2454_001455 [Aequitasia blattaphilus]|uniref:Uncharacterized protein n=1 Tax=Aequitasia blattaphilus TaxID=2949332 RepID=A0ABT1E798_9FIRM|nr:hypothetical protein [Aequitasia blattaphilus]MCP1101710.1 hypothetical protein [Aequitasia blattaphilus]MCR8614350.1 hypothetical protein [Aequitasia blattaphilus]
MNFVKCHKINRLKMTVLKGIVLGKTYLQNTIYTTNTDFTNRHTYKKVIK